MRMGFLGVRFDEGVCGGDGGKINPLSKTRYNYARNMKFGT